MNRRGVTLLLSALLLLACMPVAAQTKEVKIDNYVMDVPADSDWTVIATMALRNKPDSGALISLLPFPGMNCKTAIERLSKSGKKAGKGKLKYMPDNTDSYIDNNDGTMTVCGSTPGGILLTTVTCQRCSDDKEAAMMKTLLGSLYDSANGRRKPPAAAAVAAPAGNPPQAGAHHTRVVTLPVSGLQVEVPSGDEEWAVNKLEQGTTATDAITRIVPDKPLIAVLVSVMAESIPCDSMNKRAQEKGMRLNRNPDYVPSSGWTKTTIENDQIFMVCRDYGRGILSASVMPTELTDSEKASVRAVLEGIARGLK